MDNIIQALQLDNEITKKNQEQILQELEEIKKLIQNQKGIKEDKLMTPEEISKEYNISYNRVLQYFNDRRLKCVTSTRPFKVFRSDFEKFLKELN